MLDVGERLRGYVAADRLDGDGTVADRVRRLPAAVPPTPRSRPRWPSCCSTTPAGWPCSSRGTDRYLGVLTPGSLHAALRRSVGLDRDAATGEPG